ncbi:MAG TPA: hypothetical protein VHN99_09320 [Deinococcales bacterium]|nr:hypothetical protein [Deinococcales bacterium]
MTRTALIVLAVVAVLGAVLALLPTPPARTPGNVELTGVSMVLFPEADPDARWTFSSQSVAYNPDTRESLVRGKTRGERFLKKTLDLTLDASDVTIDSNDNLTTQQASIYIINGCVRVNLGQPSGTPVFIDQSSGYQAPYADVTFPNFHTTGGPLSASFDLERFELGNPNGTIVDHGPGKGETCVNGRIVTR